MRIRCARCKRFVERDAPLGEAHLCARHRGLQRRTAWPEVDPATRAFVALVAAEHVGLKPTPRDVRRVSGAPEYVVRRVMRENRVDG